MARIEAQERADKAAEAERQRQHEMFEMRMKAADNGGVNGLVNTVSTFLPLLTAFGLTPSKVGEVITTGLSGGGGSGWGSVAASVVTTLADKAVEIVRINADANASQVSVPEDDNEEYVPLADAQQAVEAARQEGRDQALAEARATAAAEPSKLPPPSPAWTGTPRTGAPLGPQAATPVAGVATGTPATGAPLPSTPPAPALDAASTKLAAIPLEQLRLAREVVAGVCEKIEASANAMHEWTAILQSAFDAHAAVLQPYLEAVGIRKALADGALDDGLAAQVISAMQIVGKLPPSINF
jgi:hypothetical protein